MRKASVRAKIIQTAWELFSDKGYDNTTIEDIISASKSSKASFYYYFEGKKSLIATLSTLFDEKSEVVVSTVNPSLGSIAKLAYLSHEILDLVENSIPIDLLSCYLCECLSKKNMPMQNKSRGYYKAVRQFVSEGISSGELLLSISEYEFAKAYLIWIRGLLYDWCLSNGAYGLVEANDKMLPEYLARFQESSPAS